MARAWVTSYKLEFNRAFELIAESLPRIHAELRSLLTALDSVGVSGDSFRRFEEQGARLKPTVERCRQGSVVAREQVRDAARAAESQVRGVLEGMQEARRLASTRRRASLNATVAAEHRGAEGAAFNVLTRALVELAGDEAQTSRQVEGLAEKLGGAQAKLGELDASATAALGAPNAIDTAVDELRDALLETQATVQRHQAGAEALSDRIGELMVGIQRQDIIRQGLEHVELLLAECAERAASLQTLSDEHELDAQDAQRVAKDVVLLERAATVGSTLWEGLAAEVSELVGETLAQLKRLVDSGRALAEMGEAGTSVHRVDEALAALAEAIKVGFTELEVIARLSKEQVAVLNQTAVTGIELGITLQKFTEHRTQAESVNMLMKLETARMRGLEGGAAVAGMMKDMEQQYARLLSGASGLTNRTKQMTVLVAKAAGAIAASADHLSNDIGVASRALSEHAEHAESVARDFAAGREQTASAQAAASRAATRLIAALEGLRVRDQAAAVEAAAAQSHRCAERAHGILRAREVIVEDSSAHTEWQDLVEKFTIAAHKGTARGKTDETTPLEDPGGELTLF